MKTEIIKMEETDVKELEQLWKQCFPKEFIVNEYALFDKIFFDSNLLKEGTLCIKKDNKLIGAIVTKVALKDDPVYKNTAWISALLIMPEYRNLGYGRELYYKVEKILYQQGIKKIFLGQDYNNFFSGIPAPAKETIYFFKKIGFVINETMHYDLESDIQQNTKIVTFDTTPFTEKFEVKPLEFHKEDLILSFLQEEFPDRWLYETELYFKNKEETKSYNLLYEKCAGKVKGFCVIQLPKKGQTLSGLGPIGISQSIRGHKIGEFLLQQSLLRLKELGATNVCIDWTILKEFYGKFDFIPVRTYLGSYKQLK